MALASTDFLHDLVNVFCEVFLKMRIFRQWFNFVPPPPPKKNQNPVRLIRQFLAKCEQSC